MAEECNSETNNKKVEVTLDKDTIDVLKSLEEKIKSQEEHVENTFSTISADTKQSANDLIESFELAKKKSRL